MFDIKQLPPDNSFADAAALNIAHQIWSQLPMEKEKLDTAKDEDIVGIFHGQAKAIGVTAAIILRSMRVELSRAAQKSSSTV
jgi:hypothetical protein